MDVSFFLLASSRSAVSHTWKMLIHLGTVRREEEIDCAHCLVIDLANMNLWVRLLW